MKLVKEGDPIDEFDIYLGPATCNGKPIGKWYQSRTKEQFEQDKILCEKLRAEWDKMIKSSPEGFRTSTFDVDE